MGKRDSQRDSEVGARLRMARLSRRLSQPQLEAATGITQTLISRIENGKMAMSAEHAQSLGHALGLSASALLFGEDVKDIEAPNLTMVRVPMKGVVKMGVPMYSEELEEWATVPMAICPNIEECFALEAVGDSMSGDHIIGGDILIFRPCEQVENGKIALVAVQDAQTVKRFYLRRDHIELRPSNPEHPVIIAGLSDVQVKGVLVFSYRRHE